MGRSAEVPPLVRYIFLAAACTLGVVAGVLALPPFGTPHAALVAQTPGDRMAVANDPATLVPAENPRMLVAPEEPPVALGAVDDPAVAGSLLDAPPSTPDSTTTTAPETTTTSTTSTTIAETTTTTTTVAPTTTSEASAVASLGDSADDPSPNSGVIISPKGVVLPVIGPASNGGWRASTPCGNEVTIDEGQRVRTVDFVLDPGHGGSETGAVGPNGATEKALNVRVAEIVEWYLEEAGYSVLLTRRTDIRIPLRSRAEIANALDPLAFVSIHHNGGATRRQSTPGSEVFVDAGNPEARRLGALVFEEMENRFAGYEADWVGTWRNGVSARLNEEGADLYGIHRYTPDVPSVITEAGYLSNATEAELFVDNDFQWDHGKAIARALIRWDTTRDAGTGLLEDFVDGSSSGTGGFDGCEDPSL